MTKELPQYEYLSESYAIVTFRGSRVFELVRGKVRWVVTFNEVPMEFDTFSEAERFIASIIGGYTQLSVGYRANWYVVSDSAFLTFSSEDRAKTHIENVMKVRQIIGRRIEERERTRAALLDELTAMSQEFGGYPEL